jgi:hypothetical protein
LDAVSKGRLNDLTMVREARLKIVTVGPLAPAGMVTTKAVRPLDAISKSKIGPPGIEMGERIEREARSMGVTEP